MKKLFAVCIIGLSLGTAGAFADHPDGWGVGLVGGWGGWGWGTGGFGGGGAFGLSLKIPAIPIYWSISFDLGSHYFGLGLTGDYYFMEGLLVPISGSDGFGYFIGIGGYASFRSWDNGKYRYSDGKDYADTWSYLDFGVRVPIGLNAVIPISKIKLEVFLNLAPSIGLALHFYPDNPWSKDQNRDFLGIGGGIGGEGGIRVWF